MYIINEIKWIIFCSTLCIVNQNINLNTFKHNEYIFFFMEKKNMKKEIILNDIAIFAF